MSRENDGLWPPLNEAGVGNPPVVQGLCTSNVFRKIALGGGSKQHAKGDMRLEGFGGDFGSG